MEDDVKVLWEYDGYRLVRFGTEDDGFTAFESAFWDHDAKGGMQIVGWSETGASQISGLLGALGEWFDFKDRGLTKVQIHRMTLSG